MTTLTELNLNLGISRSEYLLSIPRPRRRAGELLVANLQHSLIIRNFAKLLMTASASH